MLDHEKGHVLVTLIFHKALQQALSSFTFTSNVYKEADSIYDYTIKEMGLTNKMYDADTRHGLDPIKQAEWITRLCSQLNELYAGQNKIQKDFVLTIPVPPVINKGKDPLEYNYNNNYSLAFEEHFDQAKSKWIDPEQSGLDRNLTKASAANGILRIDNIQGKKHWGMDMYCSVDYTRDFEIELAYRVIEAKRKYYTISLFWGADSLNNYSSANIRFYGSGDGKITCNDGKKERSKSFFCYPRTPDDQFSVMSVRKMKDKYYVFINNRFEKEMPFKPLSGNWIYLATANDADVEYDYFKIFYLN